MTAREFERCDDPIQVIEYLRGRLSENELRRLGCAYLRRIWYIVTDRKARQSVELAEQWLAEPNDPDTLARALEAARGAEARAKGRQARAVAAAKRTRYPDLREKRLALADLRIARAAIWVCEVHGRPSWAVGTTRAAIARFFRTEARCLLKGRQAVGRKAKAERSRRT